MGRCVRDDGTGWCVWTGSLRLQQQEDILCGNPYPELEISSCCIHLLSWPMQCVLFVSITVLVLYSLCQVLCSASDDNDRRVHVITHVDLVNEIERENVFKALRSFLIQSFVVHNALSTRHLVTVLIISNGLTDDALQFQLQFEEMNANVIHVLNSSDRIWEFSDYEKYLPQNIVTEREILYFISPTSFFFDVPVKGDPIPVIATYSYGHTCHDALVIITADLWLSMTDIKSQEYFHPVILDSIFPCIRSDSVTDASVTAAMAIIVENTFMSINLSETCEIAISSVIDPNSGDEVHVLLKSMSEVVQRDHSFCLKMSHHQIFTFLCHNSMRSLYDVHGGRVMDKQIVADNENRANLHRTSGLVYLYEWGDVFPNPLLQYPDLLNSDDDNYVPMDVPSYLLRYEADRRRIQLNSGAGARISEELPLYDTHMHSLFCNIHERLKVSSRRTYDTDNAAAFFIPYDMTVDTPYGDSGRYSGGCSLAYALQTRLNESPAFQRSGGLDHYLVLSALLSNFITRPNCLKILLGVCAKCRIITIEDVLTSHIDENLHALNPTIRSTADPRFVIAPYPSAYHFPSHWVTPWWIHKKRFIPILFIGSTWTSPDVVMERLYLREMCEGYSPHCRWVNIASAQDYNSTLQYLYHDSIFCLIPRGPTYSRKGLIDSMMAGCIPIIFHLSTFHTLYPKYIDIPSAMTMSYYYPSSQLDRHRDNPMNCSLIPWLLDIQNSEEVHFKRQLIGENLKKLQYSYPIESERPSANPDAFDVLLDIMTQ